MFNIKISKTRNSKSNTNINLFQNLYQNKRNRNTNSMKYNSDLAYTNKNFKDEFSYNPKKIVKKSVQC